MQQQELQRLQQQQQQQQLEQQQHASAPPSSSSWSRPAVSQLEASNAELRQQLQAATSRMHDMEAAMGRLLDQQVCVVGVLVLLWWWWGVLRVVRVNGVGAREI